MIIGFAVVAVLLLLILILFPPSKGEIPQFYDENGEVIKNSISEKCYLEIGDGKLGMIIMGHSFGTYIAIKTVQQYPNYYNAYIAMAQNCNQTESEYLAYDYMKAQYEQLGNTKMVKNLEKISPALR